MTVLEFALLGIGVLFSGCGLFVAAVAYDTIVDALYDHCKLRRPS